MKDNGWNIVEEKNGMKMIWKGDKDKGLVNVRMKIKGEGRWFVFEGGLKFKCIEEDDDE